MPANDRNRAWIVVVLLFIFMVINFADKAVIGIAAVPIMQELELGLRQFGLVGSSFFLLFAVSQDSVNSFELPCWRCLQRAHIAFNLISHLIFGDFQVIARLEIHPKRRTVVEVARETQGCVSSNCAFLVDDVRDPRYRNAQVHSNPVHTQTQRRHKLLSENFSWMHRLKFLRHATVSYTASR